MTIERLIKYKELVYQSKKLNIEIEKLRIDLKRACTPSYIVSPIFDGMPRSGHISDPTVKIAMQEMDGTIPAFAQDIQNRIEEKTLLLEELKLEIMEIDSWLEMLTGRERWVVTMHLIENYPWRIVVYKSEKEFGEQLSKDTLARYQKAALEK